MQSHFVVFEAEYAPTIVIKKSIFTLDETLRWQDICRTLPRDFPPVTYLPYGMTTGSRSAINNFLVSAGRSSETMQTIIERNQYDISPCKDDKPYFYKMDKGVPDKYLWLLAGTVVFTLLVVWLPLKFMRRKRKENNLQKVALPLAIFVGIGIGFMVLEVSLFQRLVLYLGSPTISLAILLSSLLVGMGFRSYFAKKMYEAEVLKRLYVVSLAVVVVGILLLIAFPPLLSKCLGYSLAARSMLCFVLVLPLAFLLGIPFPSCIQLLTLNNNDRLIPWMYGVNGSMSVLGSILAVILSMLFGFTPSYFVGLSFYLWIFILLFPASRGVAATRVKTKSTRVPS